MMAKRKKRTAVSRLVNWGQIEGPPTRPVEPPMPVSENVRAAEQACQLPPLIGSSKQVGWARAIRADFFGEVLGQMSRMKAALDAQEVAAIHLCLEWMRAQEAAAYWINEVRVHLGNALGYVRERLAREAAEERRRQEEQARQQQEALRRQDILKKAAEGKALLKRIGVYEAQHDLPKLISDAEMPSTRQANFARRCRHQMLTALTEEEFDRVLPVARTVSIPGIWIGGFLKGRSIDYVLRQAQAMQGESSTATR